MPTRIGMGPNCPQSAHACVTHAPWAARAIAWLAGWVLISSAPAALGAGITLEDPVAERSCSQLAIEADDAVCTQEVCVLDGHAQLRCEADVRLHADHLEVRLGPARSFRGAQAQGHVLLVDGLKVLRAQALVLDADRIRGRIEHASLEVRRADAAAADAATGEHKGRNALVLHGSLERHSATRFTLKKADLTLCDCGDGCLPSWRFDAPRIEVALGKRALILWPQLRLGVANRWLVPVTPPLLPLSLPLTERAAGVLPPQIAFLSVPYPTIDVPLFMPLGPSWDLTVAPGVRTDWGAPRLSARVRYAPTEHTSGRLRVGFTHDGRRAMAQQIYNQQVRAHPHLAGDASFLAEDRALRQLSERVSFNWQHKTHHPVGPLKLDALASVVWVSDDLVNRDLLISPEQRVAAYLPSRAVLMLRHPLGTAAVAADSMLRLDNPPGLSADGFVARDYSNVRGAEATTLHRAPAVHLSLAPIALGQGFGVDADLSAVRYGRFRTVMAQGQTDQSQLVLGGALGLSLRRQLGPIDVHARAGVDAIYVAQEGASAFADAAPLTQADAGLRLAKRFASMLHVIRPQLAYRGLHKAYSAQGRMAQAAKDALDVRLLRRQTQQVLLSIHQSLWRTGALPHTRAGPWLSLDIGQPMDLRTGHLLQPFVEARLDSARAGQATARISLDATRWHSQPVRELTAQYSVGLGPATARLSYSRLAPDADRFQRSIYELAAPRHLIEPQTPSDWAHLAQGGLDVRIGRVFDVHYAALYQLPQPEARPGYSSGACAALGQSGGPSHCFVSHVVRLGYTSPCDCWGIQSVLSASPQDLLHTLRFQVVLNVAGTALGQQNPKTI